jgi:hypothetical protein
MRVELSHMYVETFVVGYTNHYTDCPASQLVNCFNYSNYVVDSFLLQDKYYVPFTRHVVPVVLKVSRLKHSKSHAVFFLVSKFSVISTFPLSPQDATAATAFPFHCLQMLIK